MARNSTAVLNALTALFLFANAAASGYRARGDRRNFAFVVFAYGTLTALLLCIRLAERRRRAAAAAGGIKAAVWALSTALNLGFAWRVAEMMPEKMAAAAVWVLALLFSVGSFYALILRRSPAESPAAGEEGEKKKLFTEEIV